jgi:hypothetical protein
MHRCIKLIHYCRWVEEAHWYLTHFVLVGMAKVINFEGVGVGWCVCVCVCVCVCLFVANPEEGA